MTYVGTLYKGVIVAKGINYTGIVADDEIELTEEEYNTIPIPCKKIDGEFISCDFPELDEFNEDINPGIITQTELVSYTGTGTKEESGACSVTFSFAPRVLIMLGYVSNNGNYQYMYMHGLYNSNRSSNIIVCDSLTTTFTNSRGFTDLVSTSNPYSYYCKKSEDGKTISWYVECISVDGIAIQCNKSGQEYHILAIG